MVDAYNSTYPLEYYKEGTVYSFYAMKKTFFEFPWPNAPLATDDQIKRFSKFLDAMMDDTEQYSPEGALNHLCRLYGVVVGKEQDDVCGKISVMFKAHGEYYVKKYAVAYTGVECDGAELLAPKAAYLYNNTAEIENIGNSKISRGATDKKSSKSGITDVISSKKGGKSGITDATTSEIKGVSGITDASTGEIKGASGITDVSESDSGKKASGITEA